MSIDFIQPNSSVTQYFAVDAEWFFDHLPSDKAEALVNCSIANDRQGYQDVYVAAGGDMALGALLWERQQARAKQIRAMSTVMNNHSNTLYLGAFQNNHIEGLSALPLNQMLVKAGWSSLNYTPPPFNLVKVRWTPGEDMVTISISDRAL